jgi:phosphate transport system substrate-binding protein
LKIFLFFVSTLILHAHEVTQRSLNISGATTIQPIIEEVAKRYLEEMQGELFIEGGGTEGGLQKLREKKADIAMVARDLSQEEKQDFSHASIAIDAVAVVLNKNKNVQNLTKEQLLDIYGGKTTDFIVISRKMDRATLNVFEAYSALFSPKRKNMPSDTKRIREDAWEAESNINTLLWVAGLKNTIAIVSHAEALRYIEMGYPIVIAAIDGISPTNESIKNGTYPITRKLNLVWDKENKRAVEFIEWSKQPSFIKAVQKLGFTAVER